LLTGSYWRGARSMPPVKSRNSRPRREIGGAG
jgi:hypothetical protein